MKSNYKKLGDYIRLVDERNTDGSVTRLLGVSIEKKFIESIANTIGTDMSIYKIVRKGQFAYGPVTSRNGDKVSIALLEEEKCIISSSYSVFEIINTKELLPEYLNLWFKRPEFDRYARFHSHGSAREIFDWEEMCNVELPVPEIEEQRKIVEAYNTIERRIALKRKINDNLQQQAQALYQKMFCSMPHPDWQNGVLSDIAVVVMGQSPDGKSYNEDGIGTVFYQGRAEFGTRFPTQRLFTTEPKRMAQENDVLISVRAPVGDLNVAKEDCCIGRGLGAVRSKDGHQSFVLYTMFALRSQLNVFNGEGTVFGSINRDSLNSLPVIIPPITEINKFEALVAPMDKAIRTNYDEICHLQSLRDALLPRLMSGEIDVSEVEL